MCECDFSPAWIRPSKPTTFQTKESCGKQRQELQQPPVQPAVQPPVQPPVYILGIDETGYGSGVGDLCVAGVVFSQEILRSPLSQQIKDSKKLSKKRRLELYQKILKEADAVYVEFGRQEDIDSPESNILLVNMTCMKKIIEAASKKTSDQINYSPPSFILIDGARVPLLLSSSPGEPSHQHIHSIVKGDARSICIGAASIVAKVERDAYIANLVEKNPVLQKYDVHKISIKTNIDKKHMPFLRANGRSISGDIRLKITKPNDSRIWGAW